MEKERKLRGDSHNGGSRRTDGGSGEGAEAAEDVDG